jgi:hypothetical protein
MPFRFRKSIQLFKGVRINLTPKGISTTAKVGGVSVTTGTRGVRGTVSIPGTGVSYSKSIQSPNLKSSRGGCAKSASIILIAFVLTGFLVSYVVAGYF